MILNQNDQLTNIDKVAQARADERAKILALVDSSHSEELGLEIATKEGAKASIDWAKGREQLRAELRSKIEQMGEVK